MVCYTNSNLIMINPLDILKTTDMVGATVKVNLLCVRRIVQYTYRQSAVENRTQLTIIFFFLY